MNFIDECVKLFLLYCDSEKNLSMKTIKAYELDLNQFIRYLIKQNISLVLGKIDKNILLLY